MNWNILIKVIEFKILKKKNKVYLKLRKWIPAFLIQDKYPHGIRK